MSRLSVELRRYACYLDEIPAPQGLSSVRGPTKVEKWKHIKSNIKKELLIKQDDSGNFTLQVLVDGVSKERIVFDSGPAVAASAVPGDVAQFSAKFPSIMCKYLEVLNNRAIIRRFQMGFTTLQDFDECCNSLQQLGFMLKPASILRPDQRFQSRTDSILSSQVPTDPPCLTPSSSQFHAQSLQTLTRRPLKQNSMQVPASLVSSSDFERDHNQIHKSVQATVLLDTQVLAGSKGLSRERHSPQEIVNSSAENELVSTKVLRLNPPYFSGEVRNSPSAYKQNASAREEICVPKRGLNLALANRENIPDHNTGFNGQCLPINAPEDSQMKCKDIRVTCTPKQASLPEDEAKLNPVQETIENENQLNSSDASAVELSCTQSLSHPLQGLVGKRNVLQPLPVANEMHEKEAMPPRPILTKDILKERIQDQKFMQWVCRVSTGLLII
ncbi:LAQU0S07e01684g1_1 [Lachancea quebecensis]|uniref:LAQU0S07e01684g1_1 n=1 Tax=Lachancea quebecensis TaxID=1654605 RepID=A0A0P1KSW3_9SACH|nr:LAQU0S07e01684g1_1 [Lachancea quebecensis]